VKWIVSNFLLPDTYNKVKTIMWKILQWWGGSVPEPTKNTEPIKKPIQKWVSTKIRLVEEITLKLESPSNVYNQTTTGEEITKYWVETYYMYSNGTPEDNHERKQIQLSASTKEEAKKAYDIIVRNNGNTHHQNVLEEKIIKL
jgi:uncharacterized protein YegL